MSNYIEVVTDGKYNRGDIQELPEDFHLYEMDYYGQEANDCYTSVYYHSKDFLDHVESTGKVRGYRSAVWTDTLVWDFDGDGQVDEVLVEVNRFVDYLITECSFKATNIRLFYSGQKGFHVLYVSPELSIFRDVDMQPIVKKLCMTIADGFEFVDSSIYDTTRIFRSTNSKHPTSGRYKIEVPLLLNDIESILEDSQTQQEMSEFVPNWEQDNTIIVGFKEIIELVVEVKKSGKINAMGMEDIITDGFTKGNANNQIMQLSGMLHHHNISDNFILPMLELINNNSKEPVPYSELSRRVSSVSEYRVGSEYVSADDESAIVTFREAGEAFVDIWNKSGEFKFGSRYKHIDDIMSLVLIGDTIGILGSSGTNKSTNGLDLTNSYAVEHDCAGLFISLEMAKHACFFRGASISYNADEEGDVNSKELASRLIHEPELREHMYEEWKRVHVLDRSLNIQQIEDYIMLAKNKILRTTGKDLRFVTVDYAQCIDGMTNIKEAANIARGLKEVAKNCGVYLLELLQTNKSIGDAYTKPTDIHIEGVQAVKQSLDWLIYSWKSTEDKHRLHMEFNKTRWNNEGKPFDLVREGLRFHSEDFLVDPNPNIL